MTAFWTRAFKALAGNSEYLTLGLKMARSCFRDNKMATKLIISIGPPAQRESSETPRPNYAAGPSSLKIKPSISLNLWRMSSRLTPSLSTGRRMTSSKKLCAHSWTAVGGLSSSALRKTLSRRNIKWEAGCTMKLRSRRFTRIWEKMHSWLSLTLL